jgi:hypothetical protein
MAIEKVKGIQPMNPKSEGVCMDRKLPKHNDPYFDTNVLNKGEFVENHDHRNCQDKQ